MCINYTTNVVFCQYFVYIKEKIRIVLSYSFTNVFSESSSEDPLAISSTYLSTAASLEAFGAGAGSAFGAGALSCFGAGALSCFGAGALSCFGADCSEA